MRALAAAPFADVVLKQLAGRVAGPAEDVCCVQDNPLYDHYEPNRPCSARFALQKE